MYSWKMLELYFKLLLLHLIEIPIKNFSETYQNHSDEVLLSKALFELFTNLFKFPLQSNIFL